MKNKTLSKLLEKERRQVNAEVAEFDENNSCSLPSDLSDGSFIDKIVSSAKECVGSNTEEQMHEYCLKIVENVIAGKNNNILIDFRNGNQKFKGCRHELGDTIVKLRVMDVSDPVYFYCQRGDEVNFIVFIGGDDITTWAFLVTENAEGRMVYIRLSELHMLSVSEESKPGKEIGLMTSYLYINAKIFSSVIMGWNLYPIKNLLMEEKLLLEAAKKQSEIKKQQEMEESKDGREENKAS